MKTAKYNYKLDDICHNLKNFKIKNLYILKNVEKSRNLCYNVIAEQKIDKESTNADTQRHSNFTY